MESWANYVGRELANRYRLENLLGVGSFGPVYAARDGRSQKAVTLRVLLPELGGQAVFDATVLTDFRHPQAVSVSDVGGIEETRYLVMSHAIGKPIQVRDPWPVERVLEFVRQVSAPLIAFHKQHDLQHLHLHPGNVFVEQVNGKQQFQVADLGLASQVGAGPLILESIRAGRTTPEFLSPEQLQGNVPSFQSDVYAFGAMLFQLLSGLPPFPYRGESFASYVLHVSKTSPPRFRDVSDQLNVDSYLESIILRCLSKSPEGRPSSIKEFVDNYEMAYRDFQTRTLSGLKLSDLDVPRPGDLEDSRSPATTVGRSPIKADSLTSRSSVPPSSPSPSTSAALPASDMLPNRVQVPVQSTQIPYRALPHGTDTVVEMFRGVGASRAVLQESQAILQTVNPQLNPWAGMGGESSGSATPKQGPRSEAVTSPNSSRLVVPLSQNPVAGAPSRGTFSPNDSQPSFSSNPVPPRPTDSNPSREPEWNHASSVESQGVRRTDQTMSPSSEPLPSTSSGSSGQSESNLTMQLQKEYLQAQLSNAVPRPVVSASPAKSRSGSRMSGPPKAVLLLVLALVVAAAGLLFYGSSVAQRVRKQVDTLVGKNQYLDAKNSLRQIHPLATIWLNRDEEIQQLLTGGLERIDQLRKERKVADAVSLTGQLDLAFAEEESLKDTEKPRRIRKEIAQGLQDEIVLLASQKQLLQALNDVDGEEAAAFEKVAKKLSAESSEFNSRATKRLIVQAGLKLASQQTNDGQHAAAFAVLEQWLKKLGNDDDISATDKEELKARHCEARVRNTVIDAKEKTQPGQSRFPEAIVMLDQLVQELGSGSCAQQRPLVLLARGEIHLEFAKSTTDSVTETTKRFDASWKDFTDALEELTKQPSDVSATQNPPKSAVLKSRAAMLLARGVWHKSETSMELDIPTKPLLLAVRDFKASLSDDPQSDHAKIHLMEIRGKAESAAHEAYDSARAQMSEAKADKLYCEAVRQLTLVIEGSLTPEDDEMTRAARLLRGLASSSGRTTDYEEGITDLLQVVSGVSETQVAEVGGRLTPDLDIKQRTQRGKRWFAVARARLAWLIATGDQQEKREKWRLKARPIEQAQQALDVLLSLIDENKTEVAGELDSLKKDCCEARKSFVVSLADAGDFEKAKVKIIDAQSYLDRTDKAWQADQFESLDYLLKNYIEKQLPYRVKTKAPLGERQTCFNHE